MWICKKCGGELLHGESKRLIKFFRMTKDLQVIRDEIVSMRTVCSGTVECEKCGEILDSEEDFLKGSEWKPVDDGKPKSNNGKLYYDIYLKDCFGFKIFTPQHLEADPEDITIDLITELAHICGEERRKHGVDGLGENRGSYKQFLARVHWEDKEMSIAKDRFFKEAK